LRGLSRWSWHRLWYPLVLVLGLQPEHGRTGGSPCRAGPQPDRTVRASSQALKEARAASPPAPPRAATKTDRPWPAAPGPGGACTGCMAWALPSWVVEHFSKQLSPSSSAPTASTIYRPATGRGPPGLASMPGSRARRQGEALAERPPRRPGLRPTRPVATRLPADGAGPAEGEDPR